MIFTWPATSPQASVLRRFSNTYSPSVPMSVKQGLVFLQGDPVSGSAHFLIGCLFLLIFSCMNCLYVLEINLLSIDSFAIIFSCSEGCLFTLCIISFAVKTL